MPLILAPISLDGTPNLSYNNATNQIATSGYEHDVSGYDKPVRSGPDALIYEYDAGTGCSSLGQQATRVMCRRSSTARRTRG